MEKVKLFKIIYLVLTLVEIGIAGHTFGGRGAGALLLMGGWIGSFLYVAILCFVASLTYIILYEFGIVDYNQKADFILHLVCCIFLLIEMIMMIIWYFTWIHLISLAGAGLVIELSILVILSVVILVLYLLVAKMLKS